MFYDGALQDGIALAVRETKLVICFVRDESQESSEWENDYFADEEIARLLQDQSVTLRLTAGTQEAGFLASFCPITAFPTVVVIKNGMLHEYIVAGTPKDDFRSRLKAVLTGNPPNPVSPEPQPTGNAVSAATVTAEPASVPPTTAAAPRATPQEPTIKPKPEKTESEKRRPEATRKPGHRISKEQAHNREQRHREEREKASSQIKQDKEDRKRSEAQTEASAAPAVNRVPTVTEEPPQPPASKEPLQYRLQIRLFDGSSVRSSFSPSDTIRRHVRPWLDEKRSDGDRPYTLKHILTPLPNHTISVAEEEHALEDLGLGPTANLVMVPVPSYIEAYASSGSSFPIRGLYAGYNIVSSAVGAIAGTVSSFLGYNGGETAPTGNTAATNPSSSAQQAGTGNSAVRPRTVPSSGINIRTLRDQREERSNDQFYNGNQLNFEPSRDDRR